jgi:hypothetical protein
MKNVLLSVCMVVLFFTAKSQLLTWTPQFPTDNSSIVITVDATKGNQGLMGYSGTVYMHLGLITSASTAPGDWRYVPTTWGSTTAPQAISIGNNKWIFQLNNPRAYFNAAAGGVPAGETIYKLALLFRDATGNKVQKNTDGSDMYIPIYPSGSTNIQFTRPALVPDYTGSNEAITATAGQTISLKAVPSTSGTLKMYYNGNLVAGPVTSGDSISANVVIANTPDQLFIAELNVGGISYYDTIRSYVPQPNVILPLPAGVKEGINYYNCSDSVTLVLYAPNKTRCMLIGDFPNSNWYSNSHYQMNRTPDGIYYWITVKNLLPQTEYAYQYLVDNSIYIADPHCEKILDPWNDKYINDSPHVNTYPNLKPYPAQASAGINGYVSVLQICEPQYNWQATNFVKPDKQNLIIYELLVRDFSKETNYQTIIDSINYFKRLGINAIEFMPLQEFSGNNSWGYNPTFYFAPDKAYGTKNKLKELIDLLHQNKIAVILDVVYNHMDAGANPQGKLYWDAVNNRPAANSPWFNPVSPQTYLSFFNDLNHTSPATKYLTQSSLEHWLKEYKIDGFRFDYSKGMTQTPSSVDNSAYDQSRIDILDAYYDSIIAKYPGTYMILEHFCVPAEENVLMNKGFMPWREMYYEYNQSLEANGGNKNFGDIMWNYNANGRNAPSPSLVGFMDSHDKERSVYNCIQYGNTSGGAYNVRDTATAVERMEAAASVLFTVPGPKMLYQFDEMGYDIPRNGNTDPKPPHWEYLTKPYRLNLYNAYSQIIKLRLTNPVVFNNVPSAYDFNANGGFVKYLQIGDPNPANMQVSIVANLGVTSQTLLLTFQKTGAWYNYLSNNTTGTGSSTAGLNGATNTTFNLAGTSQTIVLAPGEYHIYISKGAVYTFTGNGNWTDAANWQNGIVPPTTLPGGAEIVIAGTGECVLNVNQTIAAGAKITIAEGKKIRIPLNLSIQ